MKRIIRTKNSPSRKTISTRVFDQLPKFVVRYTGEQNTVMYKEIDTAKEATEFARLHAGSVYIGHLSYGLPFHSGATAEIEIQREFRYMVKLPGVPMLRAAVDRSYDTIEEAMHFAESNRPANLYRHPINSAGVWELVERLPSLTPEPPPTRFRRLGSHD